ncbi:unnamed protein product [Phytophthora lilii]|uniref:Unnamed protein product n=1 Tax=Phytophthora lilii TaxID=2077276 RepID=A0A9W6WX30_9STRA|nr:unnamed protein product [Phytophthora lilii]
MRYFIITMELLLEGNNKGLSKTGKLKRFIVDNYNEQKEVNHLMDNCQRTGTHHRESRLPPDFDWFINCAWRTSNQVAMMNLEHRLNVVTKLLVAGESRRYPGLWTLVYPKEGAPVELRLHSDLSGLWSHEPLKIDVGNQRLADHANEVHTFRRSVAKLQSPHCSKVLKSR